jgi:ABC-2 type transport system ATP-binding protein
MACAGMSDTEFIRVKGLSHCYPKAHRAALDNIDLSIPRGSSFGLLGPNGAGKTTLLSILTGLLRPQSGAVLVAGHDIKQQATQIKSLSALVPQDYAFYLALTGIENLRFFADVYGLSAAQWRERLEYCSRVCRLDDMLTQRTADYSGGMKRRLNLAIGLLNTPQILYLDEPTVGIDALSRQVIVEAIQALRAHGTTVIYTSHYMEEVEAICDEIAIIDHGRVIARNKTAQLLQQGASKLLLVNFAVKPNETLLNAFSIWRPEAVHERQYELSLGNADELTAVLATCKTHGMQVEQLQFGVSRLERIYLSLLQTNEQPT